MFGDRIVTYFSLVQPVKKTYGSWHKTEGISIALFGCTTELIDSFWSITTCPTEPLPKMTYKGPTPHLTSPTKKQG